MKVKLKICGMRDAANLREIAALQPHFFGLIFYRQSPRFVTIEAAKALPRFSEIERVGVFVNETLQNVVSIANETDLKFVQLHARESPEFCQKLKRKKDDLKIVKAFAIDENFDGKILQDYETAVDYFLFDTKTATHGGSGKSFDWQILRNLRIAKPFFLGGGIALENAREAIEACADLPLFALDVNSRAEIAAGVKSPEIVKEIIRVL